MTVKPISTMGADTAVENIAAGRQTMIRRIVSPMPPADCTYDGFRGGIAKFIKPDGGAFFVPLHYDVGDHCYFKETWSVGPDGGFLYRAKGDKAPDGWNRLLYMPPQAARVFVEITEVRAEHLHDITTEDARKMGFPAGVNRKELAHFWSAGLSGQVSASGGKWADNPWVWVISFKRAKPPKELPYAEYDLNKAKSSRKRYRVYLRKTGELIASGTADECAAAMGRDKKSFWTVSRKAQQNPAYKYRVEITDTRKNKT